MKHLDVNASLVEINRYFDRQLYNYAGFCGSCGEGCKPMLNNDVETFGLCEYNGNHPDCGDHDMVLMDRTAEVFGGYDVYRCARCDYQEAS